MLWRDRDARILSQTLFNNMQLVAKALITKLLWHAEKGNSYIIRNYKLKSLYTYSVVPPVGP